MAIARKPKSAAATPAPEKPADVVKVKAEAPVVAAAPQAVAPVLEKAAAVAKDYATDLQAIMKENAEKAMAEATEYANNISAQENDDALAEMKKNGKTTFIVPTAAEMAAMQKAMEPLYNDMASRVGKQLIDDVRKTAQGVTN